MIGITSNMLAFPANLAATKQYIRAINSANKIAVCPARHIYPNKIIVNQSLPPSSGFGVTCHSTCREWEQVCISGDGRAGKYY